MKLNRREVLATGAGTIALSLAGAPLFAAVDDVASNEAIKAFTGGAEIMEGGVELDTPEIAENGNTVPVSVSADGAVEIALFAMGNPTPPVATVKFGPLAGSRSIATRIRLAGTQDVVAVAKMEDGTFRMAKNTVKVTIGGCGG